MPRRQAICVRAVRRPCGPKLAVSWSRTILCHIYARDRRWSWVRCSWVYSQVMITIGTGLFSPRAW